MFRSPAHFADDFVHTPGGVISLGGMKAYFVVVAMLWACGGSSGTSGGDDDGPPVDASPGTPDSGGPPASSGWKATIGQDFESPKPVTIRPAKTSGGVYEGYFVAQSDLSSEPNISVSLHAANAQLSAGMTFPCARSTDSSQPFDETSVLIHWLDGATYYTNVMATQDCTIRITAAAQTAVSASISGTIYNESTIAPSSFTASFVATAQN